MRELVSFDCEGSKCAATIDVGTKASGLIIVSGGNEIRSGAHRGMAKLAADISNQGHAVFRFDRRGIGDSEGDNGSFTSSAADLHAAFSAIGNHCPKLTRIVAFGNCDAATALLLHPPQGLAAIVLGNIWVIETQDDMPPTAAIKARYIQRLKDPKTWVGLFTGAINLKKLASGLFKLAKPAAPSSLADSVANALNNTKTPTAILLANGDATALAFMEVWESASCENARQNSQLSVTKLDSASHSFAREDDYAALKTAILEALSG